MKNLFSLQVLEGSRDQPVIGWADIFVQDMSVSVYINIYLSVAIYFGYRNGSWKTVIHMIYFGKYAGFPCTCK